MRIRVRRIALVVVVAIGLLFLLQPARWPQGLLEAWLHRLTPLGSSQALVQERLAARGWLDTLSIRDQGFFKDPPGGPQTTVGAASLRADLGRYYALLVPIFPGYAEAFYGFDRDGRLIEIWVRKTIDAL